MIHEITVTSRTRERSKVARVNVPLYEGRVESGGGVLGAFPVSPRANFPKLARHVSALWAHNLPQDAVLSVYDTTGRLLFQAGV